MSNRRVTVVTHRHDDACAQVTWSEAKLPIPGSNNVAKLAVFEYIEGFYNVRRRHFSLAYRSPICFETELANGQKAKTLLPLNAADRAWSKLVRMRKQGGEHQIGS
jgi:hypothetical protein